MRVAGMGKCKIITDLDRTSSASLTMTRWDFKGKGKINCFSFNYQQIGQDVENLHALWSKACSRLRIANYGNYL